MSSSPQRSLESFGKLMCHQPNPYEDPRCQETNDPSERFFSFFPLDGAWRSQHSVSCSDVISV
jgi:hypothetical protein